MNMKVLRQGTIHNQSPHEIKMLNSKGSSAASVKVNTGLLAAFGCCGCSGGTRITNVL